LDTRKFYYDNFKEHMGKNYLKYTIYSLLLNILVNKEKKLYFNYYLNEAVKKKLIEKKQILILYILSFLPSNFLLRIKKLIKQKRNKR